MRAVLKYPLRIIHLLVLLLYFIYKVIGSGWSVALAVLQGYRGDKGTSLEYKTSIESEWGIVLLFSIISMTPGSLSKDIDEERRVIHVHLLRESNRDDFFRVTSRIERMIKRVFSERSPLNQEQL